jgi:hypothetical protein
MGCQPCEAERRRLLEAAKRADVIEAAKAVANGVAIIANKALGSGTIVTSSPAVKVVETSNAEKA